MLRTIKKQHTTQHSTVLIMLDAAREQKAAHHPAFNSAHNARCCTRTNNASPPRIQQCL
jgi:hypothetical protein